MRSAQLAPTSTRLHPGPDGWMLSPEAAAYHPASKTAVIADVHLGYEWARASGGDLLPAHSLAETLALLEALLDDCPARQLIVAGDLVESHHLCPHTRRDLAALTRWLDTRHVALVRLQGNHDPATRPPLPTTFTLDGWTIAHGHQPLPAMARTLTGHLHPALRAFGATAPCFLVSPTRIILPAFSPNAAGWNVAPLIQPHHADPAAPQTLAFDGTTWLNFGPLPHLPSDFKSINH